ncbi:MAG: alpha-amylase family glycosyl hydrolase [Oscillospiraceae bacterium]|nr:alpha-amylase family glycosyl hydrolase [Oscillospiraceae bacterium]
MSDWLKTAIFYEIYPQSFYDTNKDGIGDLPGITEKLDYIKDLGCNALWINPCFESPFFDAGYDISDYKKIAPRYGSNEDMYRLIEEAHKRSIRVLLDLVPGHTSIEHEWFKRSMKSAESKDNPYLKRYIWTETPWENFQGIEHIFGALNGICDRGSVAVNFFSTQPALNYGFANPDKEKPWQSAVDSPEARATLSDIMDVMRFWLSAGCDGFRVDMAHSLIKGDTDYSHVILLWQEIRAFLDEEFPHSVLVSEWGKPDLSLKAGFHMDFLLHFGPSHYVNLFRENPFFSGEARGDLKEFIRYYKKVCKEADGRGLICIPSGNHDMPRISHKLTPHEIKLAFVFILTVPGAPFIYYGDEIGMKYLDGIPPVEGGYERTGSRSPMQWDESPNAGFSAAAPEKLYIQTDTDENRPNVKQQSADSNSILNEVKRLINLRKDNAMLGNMPPIEFITAGEAGEPLIYSRGDGKDKAYIAINPALNAVKAKLSEAVRLVYTLGEKPIISEDGILLQPQSAVVLMGVD